MWTIFVDNFSNYGLEYQFCLLEFDFYVIPTSTRLKIEVKLGFLSGEILIEELKCEF